jgi:hypothetical protein
VDSPATRHQQRRGSQAQQRAEQMVAAQVHAGQQAAEQHDQQRPQVIDQVGFQRWRVLERVEIQRVIAEQAGDPQDQCRARHTPGTPARRAASRRVQRSQDAGDAESQRKHLERRQSLCERGQQRQRSPQHHGAHTRQRGPPLRVPDGHGSRHALSRPDRSGRSR